MKKRGPKPPEFEDRYNINKKSGCWIWAEFINPVTGYGIVRSPFSTSRVASRYSWELHFGPIPAGLQVLHKCDVRSCVNPKHLFLGTCKDNLRDMVRKGRGAKQRITHCPSGHRYTEKNTYVYAHVNKGRAPARQCRICRDRHREANKLKNDCRRG